MILGTLKFLGLTAFYLVIGAIAVAAGNLIAMYWAQIYAFFASYF